jgi:transcriptional regulator with XRE-family HTH domain
MGGKRQDLAARRRALGLTQESLAERLGVTPITIRRWETGDTKSGPRPYARHQLARHLQVPAEELEELLAEGMRKRSARAVGTMAGEVSTPGSTDHGEDASTSVPEREEPTERRDFLKLSLAAAVAPETLQDVLQRARREAMEFTRRSGASVVGRSTLDRLEAVLMDLDRSPWLDLPKTIGTARGYRVLVQELIEGPHTLKEARELYVYAAWLSEILAWLCADLGARRTAESYAVDCYCHADQAGHDVLRAWAMDAIASIALYDDRPEKALAAAEKGIHRAPRQHPLAVSLRAQSARAYARLGRRRECEAALAEMAGLYERLPSTPRIRFRVDDPTKHVVPGYAASAFIWLEDFGKAEATALEAVALHEASRSLSRAALARLDLGIALAGLGSPDGAVEQGRLALSSPRVVNSVLSRARDLKVALAARYPRLPEVLDFEEQYRQVAGHTTTC